MAIEHNIRNISADGVFAAVPGMEENVKTAPSGQASLDFMKELAQGETPEEAISFAAYLLQPRLSVWWGHECLRSIPDLMTENDVQMLELAAGWVAEPSEDRRYHVMALTEDLKDAGPGGWVATGAAWSGGSLAPQGSEPVPAPAVLCGRAVQAGVLNALALAGDHRSEYLNRFVSMAEMLAQSE